MPEGQNTTTRSFCRICTSLCGILVETSGDQVLRIRGDRDHPVSHGYTCAKGRSLPKMHHHPRRLERPMTRTADGTLAATSWDECLDDLADRLRRVIDEHGSSAIGVYFGSGVGMDAVGYRFSEKLYRALRTPYKFSPLTIDGTAKSIAALSVAGFPGFNPKTHYPSAGLIVYIGVNPVVSHGHTNAMPGPRNELKALTERAEIWVIDPRRTETAEIAGHHLAPRPGTDYAVLAFLIRELLRDGVDPDLLARQTADADALAVAVEPFDLAHTAQLADVEPEQLTELLAAVRRVGRLAVETGTGVTMSAAANVTQWLAYALMAITDSLNRPGGCWFHPGFLRPVDTGPLPVMPYEALFSPGPPTRPDVRGFLGDWPCAVLPDEIEAGNIRAVLNLGGGLLTAFPDKNALRPALQKLDVLMTIEIIANETTELSTHVLPTKDQLERPDITIWDFMSSQVDSQYAPTIVEPVGDRRSTWWVLAELGARLGFDLTAGTPAADGATPTDDEMLAHFTEGARCDFDELSTRQYVAVPHEFPGQWVDDHRERLGGWRLAPPLLVEQLAGLTGPGPLSLVPRRQMRHMNAQITEVGGDTAEILIHPDDAATAGVADGQRVVVRSVRGEITATAKVDEKIRRGAISVPHGYEEANVNTLTNARIVDLLTGMAHYSGFDITIEPAPV